ncbi:cytochrome P450 [Streptomyces sp. NPDC048275]|uniref:cytochrome P450 family protein n=1 Tax=Streptomyces sp. NPDC048275 TaxID=3155629 RepID=UPI00341113B4
MGDERHAMYADLVAQGPIHPFTHPTGMSAWMVTGYAETRALLADPRLMRGGWRIGPYADKLPEDVARGLHTTALFSDPPEHTRLRKLVVPVFTRRKVEKLAARIQQMTDDLLAAADQTEPIDLVTTLASPLPFNVIREMLGVPEADHVQFREWTNVVVSPGMYSFEDFEKGATAILEYSRELISARRLDPQDDLLSDLVAARDGEDRLTEDELTSMVVLLLLAGYETTVHLLSNGMRALLTHRDQLELLRDRPDLMESAIEEVLRYDGPVQITLPYRVAKPIEVGNVTLSEGDLVHFALMGVNREDEHFPSGDTLDITREANSHLAFGHGIHYCLGAPLARVEARIVFSTLLERYPRLRLAVPAEELTRIPGWLMNGVSTLPVHLH